MFNRRRSVLLIVLVFSIIIAAYFIYPLWPSISRPQRAPLDYLLDVQPIPPGKYLFVESWEDVRGTFICEEDVLIDEPTYGYTCAGERCSWEWGRKKPNSLVTDLWSDFLGEEPNTTDIIGFWGLGISLSGVGGGDSSILYPINQFPQKEEQILLKGASDEGVVVVEIEGFRYLLEPGESWMHSEYADDAWFEQFYDAEGVGRTPGCTVLITRRFTNFGLLDASEIDVDIPLETP